MRSAPNLPTTGLGDGQRPLQHSDNRRTFNRNFLEPGRCQVHGLGFLHSPERPPYQDFVDQPQTPGCGGCINLPEELGIGPYPMALVSCTIGKPSRPPTLGPRRRIGMRGRCASSSFESRHLQSLTQNLSQFTKLTSGARLGEHIAVLGTCHRPLSVGT